MKTTSYEISKKLKEIGFSKKSHQFYWVKYKNDIMPQEPKLEHWEKIAYTLEREEFPAYDLETLLEALPKYVARNSDTCGEKNSLQVCVASKQIYYDDDLGIYKGYRDLKQLFFTTTIDNESLADTAGRLLIKLFEAGIVNFNK